MNEQFTEGLARIREKAGQEKSVAVADILAAFPGQNLSDAQIRAVYDYLDEEGITLKDYVPHDTSSLNLGSDMEQIYGDEGAATQEEQKLFDFYMEDLASVAPLDMNEVESLKDVLRNGTEVQKKAARDRLTEGNLRYVVRLARSQAGRGVPLSDLIQEGNMALVMGLYDWNGEDDLDVCLEKSIKDAMKALLKEQAGFDRSGARMAADANRILETVREFEEENSRAATASELAKRLGMPVSRVEEVLRESAKAIRNEEH